MRLAGPRQPALERPRKDRNVKAPLVALLLALVGVAAFALGATAGTWPLWAAGLLAVAGSLLAYKP
jgi:hypothetical protein